MELFHRLFGSLLAFVYHCFDRVVINGYLSALSRPENVVYFFRDVLGLSPITKEVLAQKTQVYQRWVESYSRQHGIPMQWAEKGVRKEDYVQPWLQKMKRRKQHGVYFIFKSMEQGSTFRALAPKYPTGDPDYRILSKQRSRFTHYYFYIRDAVLGPMVIRVSSFLPFQTAYYLNGHNFMENELQRRGVRFRKHDNAFLSTSDPAALQEAADAFTPEVIRPRLEYWTALIGPKFSEAERQGLNLTRFYAVSQIEYCRNFIFRRNFQLHKLFERACELGLGCLSADKISQIFGARITKRLQGKLATVLEKVEHGHHVLRAYWKNAFVKQYEKFSRFLRQEVCSNNLSDFRLKKGLEHLGAIRDKFLQITDRFAAFQAQCYNVHIDFPLFQRLALPIMVGSTKLAGIKIQDTRMLRLMEVLLHAGTQLSGWRTSEIYEAILVSFGLSKQNYSLAQLRYDIRKMKAHGLVARDGKHYRYRLTEKGCQVTTMFVLFHKRVCGPLANSLFRSRPRSDLPPVSRLETAYRQADTYVQDIINILAAA